jgi:hypothetical protein
MGKEDVWMMSSKLNTWLLSSIGSCLGLLVMCLNFFKVEKLTLVYMAFNLNRLVGSVDSSNRKILTYLTMLNKC